MKPMLKTSLSVLSLLMLLTGCAGEKASSPVVNIPVASAGDAQEIEIIVDHAYTPSQLSAKAGLPIRLNFHREEENPSCAKDLEIPSQDVKLTLINHEVHSVEIPPQAAGTVIPFHCGMNMMKGQITVQD